MLVNRYFGSKEQLFAEVVAEVMTRPIILTDDRLKSARGGDEMAETLVRLTTAGGAPLDGFQIMCRSAASPRAAEIGRRQIEAHYHKALASALPGEHAAERAALLLAFVAGVQIMRQMIGLHGAGGLSAGRCYRKFWRRCFSSCGPARVVRRAGRGRSIPARMAAL